MVLESALITVNDPEGFLGALEQAKLVIAQAEGFRGIEARRGIERPDTFLLLITWDSLEHHTVGFRQGPLFPQWRSHIGPFFADAPTVEHWSTIA